MFRNYFCILTLLFCLTQVELITPNYAKSAVGMATNEASVSPVSQILQTVLEKQSSVLSNIEFEQKSYAQNLKKDIIKLGIERQKIYNNFSELYIIYTSEEGEAVELNPIVRQLHNFLYEINKISTVLEQKKEHINIRLQQLSHLIESLTAIDDLHVQTMLKRAHILRYEYDIFNQELQKASVSTEKIVNRISIAYDELNAKMPIFWLNFYVHKKTDYLSQFKIIFQPHFINHFFSNIKLALLREIPSSFDEWREFCANTIFISLIFSLIFFAFHKASILLPQAIQNTWNLLLKEAMPCFILGISLFYASQFGTYDAITGISVILLSYAQIRMAWILLCINREEQCTKSSPFMPVLILYIVSFTLLTFFNSDAILSFCWIIFLIYFPYYMRKIHPINLHLSRLLIRIFYVVITVSLFLVLTKNLVHLSFFIILIYVWLMLGIHQAEACLHAASLLSNYISKSNNSALAYGFLLSLSTPILLIVAFLSPLSLLITYPGGDYLFKAISNFNITIGKVTFNTTQALEIAICFYLIKLLIKISHAYIDNTWTGNVNSSLASITTPIKTSIFFGGWGCFLLYVLKIIGFSLTNLAVVAGGLSVGVGLGMQNIVQNTFSGFLLIFGQNIREGDYVEVDSTKGFVEKVSLRATIIRTTDNAIMFIPNSEFLAKTFTNWTHNGRMVRCRINFGVGYNSNIDMVKETALATLSEEQHILKNPTPSIRFIEFGNSALNFQVRFWIANVNLRTAIISDAYSALNAAFKEKNIEIPFPQTDIHIRNNETNMHGKSLEITQS